MKRNLKIIGSGIVLLILLSTISCATGRGVSTVLQDKTIQLQEHALLLALPLGSGSTSVMMLDSKGRIAGNAIRANSVGLVPPGVQTLHAATYEPKTQNSVGQLTPVEFDFISGEHYVIIGTNLSYNSDGYSRRVVADIKVYTIEQCRTLVLEHGWDEDTFKTYVLDRFDQAVAELSGRK